MPSQQASPIHLSPLQQELLQRLVHRAKSEQRLVKRGHIILEAAQGTSNNIHKLTVSNRDTNSLASLNSRGATALADYGLFSLWQATSQQITDLVNRATVEVRDDFDTIHFRGVVQINTYEGEPAVPTDLRQSRTTGSQFSTAPRSKKSARLAARDARPASSTTSTVSALTRKAISLPGNRRATACRSSFSRGFRRLRPDRR